MAVNDLRWQPPLVIFAPLPEFDVESTDYSFTPTPPITPLPFYWTLLHPSLCPELRFVLNLDAIVQEPILTYALKCFFSSVKPTSKNNFRKDYFYKIIYVETNGRLVF